MRFKISGSFDRLAAPVARQPFPYQKKYCRFSHPDVVVNPGVEMVSHSNETDHYAAGHVQLSTKSTLSVTLSHTPGTALVIFMLKGSVNARISPLKDYHLFQGQYAILYNAYGDITLEMDAGEYEWMACACPPDFFHALNSSWLVEEGGVATSGIINQGLIEEINAVKSTRIPSPRGFMLLEGRIKLLLVEVLDDMESCHEKEPEAIAFIIKEFVDNNLQNPELISVSALTKAYHISESTFRRIFKSNFGMAFTDYIQKMKIERVKMLLEKAKGKPALMDLASEVGYEDHRTLSRLFKKCVGLTPIEYWLSL